MIRHKQMLLDVGGTFIKCFDGREIMINSNGSREDIISSLKEAVGDAGKVAVAIPGPFDFKTGTFLMRHKFSSVYGERFCDLVGRDASCFRFIHDVNCMLVGELCKDGGNLKVAPNTALITLGTGLGFSMCIDGHVLVNEVGSPKHAIYNIPCRDTILEDYVSKRGVLRGYDGKSAKEVAKMAYDGDYSAIARFEECGALLSGAVAPILEKFKIEQVLFGGQISRSFSLFEGSVRAGLSRVECIRRIAPVSDISNATFNGLRVLMEGKVEL